MIWGNRFDFWDIFIIMLVYVHLTGHDVDWRWFLVPIFGPLIMIFITAFLGGTWGKDENR